MKKSVMPTIGIVLAVLLTILTFSPNIVCAQKQLNGLRIGVYDSRIIVLAYTRSEHFARHQDLFRRQSDSAQKVNDTVRLKELSIQALSYQHLLHLMVFGSGSTSAIVNLVKEQLPELARKAGVTIIMSKFDLTWTDSNVQTVDVTDELVHLFNPKENIDELSKEIAKTDPIPLEDLTLEEDLLDLYCVRYGKK